MDKPLTGAVGETEIRAVVAEELVWTGMNPGVCTWRFKDAVEDQVIARYPA
jgi:hypothetical protein